ncbi:MAG: transposase [Gammaproteobacteria bacterium]|nr:transposase [Gammaproteobacteria bacterium]
MARPLRIEFAGAMYHVMSRGNARADVFRDDGDRRALLSILGRVCGRFEWTVWAYCLMDNHYHFLVETGRPSLARGMRELNGQYTQFFNRRHRRVGHLLQGRYKATLVEKDAYLMELSRYVVLNPVRAGMVKTADAWPWSSYCAVTGKTPSPEWLATGNTLALFDADGSRARRAYARFVAEGVSVPDPMGAVRRQLFLGTEQFVEAMMGKVGRTAPSREVPRRQRPVRSLSTYEGDATGRDQAIRSAYDSGGYTLVEIGAHFGLHYSVISRIARGCYSAEADRLGRRLSRAKRKT